MENRRTERVQDLSVVVPQTRKNVTSDLTEDSENVRASQPDKIPQSIASPRARLRSDVASHSALRQWCSNPCGSDHGLQSQTCPPIGRTSLSQGEGFQNKTRPPHSHAMTNLLVWTCLQETNERHSIGQIHIMSTPFEAIGLAPRRPHLSSLSLLLFSSSLSHVISLSLLFHISSLSFFSQLSHTSLFIALLSSIFFSCLIFLHFLIFGLKWHWSSHQQSQ